MNTATTTARAVWLKNRPVAHRGLHDMNRTIFENTLTAVSRAIDAGYAIEVDLQWTSDGVPVVFHDFTLERLTAHQGRLRDTPSTELTKMTIGGTSDTIPTLRQLLDTVKGRAGLVLEMKGEEGCDEGFVTAITRELEDYHGDFALMSFDYHLLRDARRFAPHLPLGLTAEGRDTIAAEDGGNDNITPHHAIAEETQIDFASWYINDLPNSLVTQLRQANKPVISWTIRNAEQLAASKLYCDQPTFEGITP